MFNSRSKRFRRNSFRLSILVLLCAGFFIYLFATRTAQVQVNDPEPIATTGHGALFNRSGHEIVPTLEFITKAQAWYMADLTKKLPAEKQAVFSKLQQAAKFNLALDGQSQLVLNSRLIDWLLDANGVKNTDRLRAKTGLLKHLLKRTLPDSTDVRKPWGSEPFKVDPRLVERLNNMKELNSSHDRGPGRSKPARMFEARTDSGAVPAGPGVDSILTGQDELASAKFFVKAAFSNGPETGPEVTDRADTYRDVCRARGVPVPPNIGGVGWGTRRNIPRSKLFIFAGKGARVMTYVSTSPPGMCIALPRFSLGLEDDSPGSGANLEDNQVDLDGVICFGQTNSQTCFWDNRDVGGAVYNFPLGTPQDFDRWAPAPFITGGDTCSDCHAGENPYIIHPEADTVLGGLRAAGLPTFAPNFNDPIINATWPDPDPMNSPSSCVLCHGRTTTTGSRGGRLPHLSTSIPSYCTTVLRAAVGAKPLSDDGVTVVQNPSPTMPATNPGGLVCTPNLRSGDPGFIRDCPPEWTACNLFPLEEGNRFNLRCAPELSGLLNWCGVPPRGDASSRGEPHNITVNGTAYDFQGAGEFVHLRGANGLEVQTRQTPIASAGSIPPDAYTGLESCVSIITAVATRVGSRRVTLQPGPQQLELRVDGKIQTLGPKGIDLGDGGRVTRIETGSGIEIFFPDGTRLIVTTHPWPPQNTWFMNVDVVSTQAREGIMGAITPSGWLPALPDGMPMGPMPALLSQRYVDLNQKFADAWRVKDATSLFDYAPGTSTSTFTDRSWPPERPPCVVPGSTVPPAYPIDRQKAEPICKAITDPRMHAQCVFDVMVTGEPGFATAYETTQRLLGRRP